MGEVNKINYSFYLIIYELQKPKIIKVGRLGTFEFLPGYYIYIGRDKRNIRSRVARHIALNKSSV